MGNCLLALLFKTSALFTAPAALCGGAHSSIHSSTLYPPVPPTICISYQFLLILQSFKEERKKGFGGRDTSMCLGTVLWESPSLPRMPSAWRSKAPDLLRLLAPPSFPLLTALLPAVCTYSQVLTIMGTVFHPPALLLTHRIGRTSGFSQPPLWLHGEQILARCN